MGQSRGMLWGAALHRRCGEEHHPSRKAAHKLETTPQPHQSPPRTAGQDSFCTTLTFPPSQIPFKPQLWQIWSCPMVWQAHGSGSGSKQPFACSSQPCPLSTIELQTSSFRPAEISTLLSISQPWLKYLSQPAQMFNLWKHLNIILEKPVTLCCKLCRASEFSLLLSDFCQHFARKEANAGGRVTLRLPESRAVLSPGRR